MENAHLYVNQLKLYRKAIISRYKGRNRQRFCKGSLQQTLIADKSTVSYHRRHFKYRHCQ